MAGWEAQHSQPVFFMAYDTSAANRLAQVRTAISAILGGSQSYTVMGNQFNRANISTLYRMEEDLQRQVNAESRVKPRVSHGTFNRSGGF